jgi:hypothetical protein
MQASERARRSERERCVREQRADRVLLAWQSACLGSAALHSDALVHEAASSSAASSCAHAAVEDVADVQSLRRALAEQPLLLASPAGGAQRAAEGRIAASQCRLLHAQLLHAALQLRF